jgi:hypothetical protein
MLTELSFDELSESNYQCKTSCRFSELSVLPVVGFYQLLVLPVIGFYQLLVLPVVGFTSCWFYQLFFFSRGCPGWGANPGPLDIILFSHFSPLYR